MLSLLGERLKKSGEDLAQVVNAGMTNKNVDEDDDDDWIILTIDVETQ